jgi:hypothetical protein
MASTITAIPLEGINFKERYVPSLERPRGFTLGTPTIGNENDTWIYVQADVPVTAPNVVLIVNTTTPGPTFFHITAASGGAGDTAWAADTSFLTGEVGWVRKVANPLD